MVTTDEIGDPLDLHIRTYVNDDLRQDGHTADVLFNIYETGVLSLQCVHTRSR
ncbi:MAG: fumarylacetoacetate hydrolase family protein [Solirubrobacteraceae bacterium]